VSAHPVSQRRGLIASMAAQVAAYVLEPVEETIETEPVELEPHPVIAVVSASARSGATTVARLLAAELASRGDGAAVVSGAAPAGRGGPPVRAATRLATALRTAGRMRPVGRLCLAQADQAEGLVNAARYLAPVVFDLAPDGSAASAARIADRVVVVAGAACEPALAAAVRLVLGGEVTTVVNRVVDRGAWEDRADIFIPESRIAARAAALGTRALGPMGTAIADLADRLEHS
jgi:Mrp family chromosome partitioning ATPase